VAGVALLLASPSARADSILLRGGERLIGKVKTEAPDKVGFESQALGLIEIPRDRIERLERDEPPPPPEADIAIAAATPAPAHDSIEPAPPTTPPAAAKNSEPTAQATAVAAPAPTAPVGPAAPLVAPVMAAHAPEPTPGAPAAGPAQAEPAVVTVFYPWSGLKTEQDTFDWIQLKSGEWLKGQIKSMQEFKLAFDSEKMDLREFDWDDIITVRSPRLNSLRFEKSGIADGSVLITGNEVRVVAKAGTKTYPRADLLAITPTGENERSKWTGKLTLGFNYRTGNSEEIIYNAHGALQRRTPATRLSLDYLGNFSRINGSNNANNQRVTAQFDYFLSRQLYLRLPDAEFYSDPIQNIDKRLTLGAAVGYDLFRTQRVEWDVSVGPAYQRNWFSSVEAGQDPYQDSFTVVLSTHLDVQMTKRVEWIFDYRGQLTKKNSGGATHHANSTIEFEIHKRLKLDLSLIWDRVTSPVSESGGATPTPDDLQLVTALGVDF
jgi:hypothetical protein